MVTKMKNDNWERNAHVNNKSADEIASKRNNKNVSKLKETRSEDKASTEDDTYLNNTPLL